MNIITCEADLVITSEGFIQCPSGFGQMVGNPSASIDSLTAMLATLFTFDPEIFGFILLGFILVFIKGWVTGVILRYMGKS